MKIAVGTNSLTESQYPAYTNHCQFWFRLGRKYPNINFCFINPSRMTIDRMRNMSGKVAQEIGADYLLFLDDDVIVPQDVSPLQGLLDCDADIAAGNVVVRGYPFNYMVLRQNLIAKSDEAVSLSLLSEPGQGIEEVDAVGFSFCLIKTSLLDKVPMPWFVTGPTFTEDVYFCVKARQVYPELTVRVNWDVVCSHILWPEMINGETRLAYKEYFETIYKQNQTFDKEKLYPRQRAVVPYEQLVLEDTMRMQVK